jgi:hypothetical protein
MHGLRVLGTALIVSGIVVGTVTFVVLSYGTISGAGIQMYWFWQGPVLGAAVAIIGAGLVALPRGRGRRRTIP